MTARTSERLAKALDAVGLTELAGMARDDMFHDFLSPYDLPELELEARLRSAVANADNMAKAKQIEAVRQRLIDGDFDADTAESEEWAQSKDGQETFSRLIKDK